MTHRLRAIDSIGRMSDGRYSVLLPYTDATVGRQFLHTLLDVDANQELPADCDVFEYRNAGPNQPLSSEVKGAGRGTRDSGDLSSLLAFETIEKWSALPTPPWKRAIDIFGATTGLILLSPVFAAVAIGIKLFSPGPVFFSQARTGHQGETFMMHKFRSMTPGAEQKRESLIELNQQDGPAFKILHDPRITPIGRWLRATSLDELPQLWNVLKGEMSLVGPRPLPCKEADQCASWQRRRHAVKPGITCFWQVKDRTTTIPFVEWMRMDVRYVQQHRLGIDLKLILQTILFVISRKGY